MKTPSGGRRARLVIRQAQLADLPALVDLTARVYGAEWGHSAEMLRGQITRFAAGQFVAEYEGRIVGYCATFRIDEATAFAPHTWAGITGGGFASRHDPDGDWLYGMDVCVDPAFRGLRIGRRLYVARKRLCQDLGLEGIVFGGRLPGLARHLRRYGSAEAYVDAVRAGRQHDATLTFQLRNGFEYLGLLPNYLPGDRDSLGYAAHLAWRDPARPRAPRAARGAAVPDGPRVVRVAAVQYGQRPVADFEEFAARIEYFVGIAAGHEADFVVFPELVTLQLLSIGSAAPDAVPLAPDAAIRALTGHTPRIRELFSRLALRYHVNLIGGSHPTLVGDEVRNLCHVCLRDGAIHVQEKIHVTPGERRSWGIRGGSAATAIATDCGPVGILICYDAEFPELARHLVDQGALILFVPFCTDERQGYLRVRYCSQARAVENQCYVVLAGNVGALPGVADFDIQYAQSGILTPCDFPFARDGIAAEATANAEMVLFADLHLDDLARARNAGTVRNLRDRRHDLYQARWRVPR